MLYKLKVMFKLALQRFYSIIYAGSSSSPPLTIPSPSFLTNTQEDSNEGHRQGHHQGQG